MSFNPDPSKQAKKVKLSRIGKKIFIILQFISMITVVNEISKQKYLGLILDKSLSFEDQIKLILSKVCETIGFLRKLNRFLPRFPQVTIEEQPPEVFCKKRCF